MRNVHRFAEGTEFIHFGIIVEDLASIYNTLRDGGFELIMDNVKKGDEIDDNKPPDRSFKVADPDGNVVDITCGEGRMAGCDGLRRNHLYSETELQNMVNYGESMELVEPVRSNNYTNFLPSRLATTLGKTRFGQRTKRTKRTHSLKDGISISRFNG